MGGTCLVILTSRNADAAPGRSGGGRHRRRDAPAAPLFPPLLTRPVLTRRHELFRTVSGMRGLFPRILSFASEARVVTWPFPRFLRRINISLPRRNDRDNRADKDLSLGDHLPRTRLSSEDIRLSHGEITVTVNVKRNLQLKNQLGRCLRIF